MKTLVLGGYGNFGARICRALAGDPTIELMIGGRNAARARALADELGSGAEGVAIDLASPAFSDELRRLGVALLIHTAGPFQDQSYDVAQAAARAGAHYIDLADGRRFVCDFPSSMDAAFLAAGRVGISGASTVPALSSAVVESLTRGWRSIRDIDICIAPAQTAPRGEATLAAVLSYCGGPVQVWDEGRWSSRPGWANPTRVEFARLRPRLGALCDIPDLELFPSRYGVTNRVIFRAALEVGLTQRAMGWLATLRRIGLLKQPSRLAALMQATAPAFDFLGSALGGMVVRVEGDDSTGRRLQREWHIAADDDHGPEIPCMAAILLARRLAHGEDLTPGAHACKGLLSLDEFRPEFERWGMVTDLRE
ncbi:saccharopine dehydrogenase family protein [Mitsuaria sp. 7]|uniref:saccharopine dehydrogenase family protein n=1 Tax=Mitsuaria sp. 7 TaxID=1658665 RepID=UPI0007DD44CD|nr:saccharopine dehydrogenase NADP-binding domain-containing protein [Mitsuaria sp. 7]ANH66890.1 saccharopine dehydrogenase [Mitsuaria sp. 7]